MDKIKQYLGYAYAALITFLGAVVYYLLQKNKGLNSKVGQLEAEDKLAKVLTEKELAEKEAEDSEKEYNRLRDEFVASIAKRDDE